MTEKNQNQLKLEKALEKIEMDYAICLRELNKSKLEARVKAYEKAGQPEGPPEPPKSRASIIFLP